MTTHPNNGDTQDELETIALKLLDDYAELSYEVKYNNDDLKLLPGDVKIRREQMVEEALAALRQHIDKVVEAVIGEDETVNSHYVPNGNYEVVNKESEPAYFRNLERAKQRLRYKQLKGEA